MQEIVSLMHTVVLQETQKINLYSVKKQTKTGMKVNLLLFQGNNLFKHSYKIRNNLIDFNYMTTDKSLLSPEQWQIQDFI